jgi:hypothetical protein
MSEPLTLTLYDVLWGCPLHHRVFYHKPGLQPLDGSNTFPF